MKLSLEFLKNRELTAQYSGVNKMLAYGRIPMFLNALMQVPCSKTNVIRSNSIKSITFEMIKFHFKNFQIVC